MTDLQFIIGIICLTVLALGLMVFIILRETLKTMKEEKEVKQ